MLDCTQLMLSGWVECGPTKIYDVIFWKVLIVGVPCTSLFSIFFFFSPAEWVGGGSCYDTVTWASSFVFSEVIGITTGLALGAKEKGSFGPLKSINTNFKGSISILRGQTPMSFCR